MRKKRVQYGVRLALGCAFLALTGSATGQSAPKIHPPADPHVYAAVVVSVRQAPAYRYALGAQRDEWGHLHCMGRGGNQLHIKRTTIFRLETASRFFDLSKVCGMSGDFRWPSVYKVHSVAIPPYDTWNNWERLVVGDRVKMILKPTTVQLTESSCESLGLIKPARGPKRDSPIAVFAWQTKRQKYVASHCNYQVPIMHVRLTWSTTEVNEFGRRLTDTRTQTWDFRVVGRGPRSAAKTSVIGANYSRTLAPPWDAY